MKKIVFGIGIGTVFSIILCLIAAVVFWFFVEYSALSTAEFVESVYPEVSC